MEMGAGNAGVDEMEAIRLGELATIVSQTPMLTAAQPAAATTMNERMEAPPNRATQYSTLLRCSEKDSHVDVLEFLIPPESIEVPQWNFLVTKLRKPDQGPPVFKIAVTVCASATAGTIWVKSRAHPNERVAVLTGMPSLEELYAKARAHDLPAQQRDDLY